MSALALILCLLFSHTAGATVYAGTAVGVDWNCKDGQHGNTLELVGDPGLYVGNTEC